MTLDATVGGATANSYATVAQADAYFATRPRSSAWTSLASDAVKEPYLIMATRIMDFAFDFYGSPTDIDNQALRWPRAGVLDRDWETIDERSLPQSFLDAFFELVLDLVAKDRLSDPKLVGQGFTEVTLDVITVKADMRAVQSVVPRTVVLMLSHLGLLKPAAGPGGGGWQARLKRG